MTVKEFCRVYLGEDEPDAVTLALLEAIQDTGRREQIKSILSEKEPSYGHPSKSAV